MSSLTFSTPPPKKAFRILPNSTGECNQLLKNKAVSFQGWTAWQGHTASVAERMCGYREEQRELSFGLEYETLILKTEFVPNRI